MFSANVERLLMFNVYADAECQGLLMLSANAECLLMFSVYVVAKC